MKDFSHLTLQGVFDTSVVYLITQPEPAYCSDKDACVYRIHDADGNLTNVCVAGLFVTDEMLASSGTNVVSAKVWDQFFNFDGGPKLQMLMRRLQETHDRQAWRDENKKRYSKTHLYSDLSKTAETFGLNTTVLDNMTRMNADLRIQASLYHS